MMLRFLPMVLLNKDSLVKSSEPGSWLRGRTDGAGRRCYAWRRWEAMLRVAEVGGDAARSSGSTVSFLLCTARQEEEESCLDKI